MTKRNRLIALSLVLTILFAMLFSVCFVIVEAHHDCIGDDCPICTQINICENTLRSFGLVAAVAIVAAFLGVCFVAGPVLAVPSAYNTSLVSLKVKLSN